METSLRWAVVLRGNTFVEQNAYLGDLILMNMNTELLFSTSLQYQEIFFNHVEYMKQQDCQWEEVMTFWFFHI